MPTVTPKTVYHPWIQSVMVAYMIHFFVFDFSRKFYISFPYSWHFYLIVIMSKAVEKEAQPSVDMEALSKKKLEDTTFADLVRIY